MQQEKQHEKSSGWGKAAVGLLIATLLVVTYNAFQTSQLRGLASAVQAAGINTGAVGSSSGSLGDTSFGSLDVIPKGVPKIYGKEFGVSFDDVSPSDPQKADSTIGKLGVLDQRITLAGDDLKRYIAVVGQISCEYCCGAPSIIFDNGQAACGCAHSFAMRGLAKYLIKNHGSEYTDNEILEELGKWKTLFFPTQMMQKAKVLQGKGVELNYVNLASNKYRGAEKDASGAGGMVGGC